MSLAQILSLSIFVVMFILIITEIYEKHRTTLVAGFLMITIVFGVCMHSKEAIWSTLNISSILTRDFYIQTSESSSSGINWQTIFFIVGMMIMVEGMAMSGFFKWLCLSLAKLVKYNSVAVFFIFMFLSFILSMFIDSITVIMFLAAITVELTKLFKLSPIPFVFSEIFCANLGGSATMCGDPPNIIIGTSLGFTFMDFMKNTGIMASISMLFVVIFFYICYRKEIISKDIDVSLFPEAKNEIKSRLKFVGSVIIFLLTVVLLVTHGTTHLTVSTIGIFVAVITLVFNYDSIHTIISNIDYKTILFFIGLFVVVSGIEITGVLDMLSALIGKLCGGNVKLMIIIIIFGSAIISAIIDNIPYAATIIPIIKNLSITQGVDLNLLAWTATMGTDIGGNATPIGASANVVGTSIVSRNGYRVTWGKYCKYMVPATIIVIIISTIYLFTFY